MNKFSKPKGLEFVELYTIIFANVKEKMEPFNIYLGNAYGNQDIRNSCSLPIKSLSHEEIDPVLDLTHYC